MRYIDLHVHSNMSDGTLSPTEVVELAADTGLAAIALTDHDTVRGVEEALNAAKELNKEGKDIRVIPGVEISVAYKKRDIHILGLNVDYHNKDFVGSLNAAVEGRNLRNIKMCQNLNSAGIDVTIEKLQADNKDTVITRAHFARYIKEHGYVKTTKDAFKKYLNSDTPYYVPREYMSMEHAVKIITSANGIPVLAHPLLYNLKQEELDTLIDTLKSYGLKGIETFYSCNTGCDESDVRRMARLHELVMTGGSDFHGANKPDIKLGLGRGNLKIPETILTELEI